MAVRQRIPYYCRVHGSIRAPCGTAWWFGHHPEIERSFNDDVPEVEKQWFSKINNNNNKCQDNVYGAVIVTYSYCESSPGSSDESSLGQNFFFWFLWFLWFYGF